MICFLWHYMAVAPTDTILVKNLWGNYYINFFDLGTLQNVQIFK